MDTFTIGFLAVVILFMAGKFLFGFYMYRKSIYKVLYSGFTEYRMRRKSIEGMSESYVLKEQFGPGRMIYHVLEKKDSMPSAYIAIFLTSGGYIVKVLKENKNTNLLIEAEEFKQKYIMKKLSVFKSLHLPTAIIAVLPDSIEEARIYPGKKDILTVQRKELLNTIKELHEKSAKILTADEVYGIFMALAHDAIENETITMQS